MALKNRCYRTGKYTVCRRVPASFSPETLQAGAAKGLIEGSRFSLPLSLSVPTVSLLSEHGVSVFYVNVDWPLEVSVISVGGFCV